MRNLIILVSQLNVMLFGKLPPVTPCTESDQLGFPPRPVPRSAPYQSSKPLGGLRLYLCLYSRTASDSVRLCLSHLAFHRCSARSINT